MFGLKKKTEDETVDFSAPLARALKNPVDRQATPAGKPIDPELRQMLSAIEATFYVIDQVREVLSEASQLVLRAKDVEQLAGRALLAEQFDELRQSITQILEDADSDAQQLLGSPAKPLSAQLNAQSRYTIAPARLDISEGGLNLPPPVEAFSTTSEIAGILGALEQALGKLDDISSDYMRDAKFLISRLEK